MLVLIIVSLQLQVHVHCEEVYCRSCYPQVSSHQAQAGTSTATIRAETEQEACPRCGGKVAPAPAA